MKLQFRHQKFQADAARAVCDVFTGQPYLTPGQIMNKEAGPRLSLTGQEDHTVLGNAPIVQDLNDEIILENLHRIQRAQQIALSPQLAGRYNLTIEMETGVGKTYTYIKTMFELNQRYGWNKFIIVVPSVAIREGVYKALEETEEHFAGEYGKKIRYFIYNSARLHEIDHFASGSGINAMIINSQAFNARSQEARRIYMRLDEFRSRRPIDIIGATRPILIIDEPQSVEGKATKARLGEFNPLFTLRYSATHRAESIYNMVFRLDAMDAYNRMLVKKISVKGIAVSGTTGTGGYIYLESVNISSGAPSATIEHEAKGTLGLRVKKATIKEGYNLFCASGELPVYRHGYTVLRIDGRDNSIELANGKKLFAGDAIGKVKEEYLRRIQIRETIASHLERERALHFRGIKVLSLFFIDEVAKYRRYDASGAAKNGEYADIFEEEYNEALKNMLNRLPPGEYREFLASTRAETTHAGYFSIDRKNSHFVDSRLGDRRERTSDDSDAYDLIMRNKERLLDMAEPVRFIFSHSALREGWDNPNVFQICTLKQSGSNVRKRQEVGRGLRLAVNQNGERMDASMLGADVHGINVLTVIASESYDSFARGLQAEIAEAVAGRPRKVSPALFLGRAISERTGMEQIVDEDLALAIYDGLVTEGYVKKGILTDKYYAARKAGVVALAPEAADLGEAIMGILDSVYAPLALENARDGNIEAVIDRNRLESSEFQTLWSRISSKSAYVVKFDENNLVAMAIAALNRELRVSRIFIRVEAGVLKNIPSGEDLRAGSAMYPAKSKCHELESAPNTSIRYDLVGKIGAETGLTRKTVVDILCGLNESVFEQFKINPEEFIIRSAAIVNECKAEAIIHNITYDRLEAAYDVDIFTDQTLKGRLGVNAMAAHKHLYDHILYDSENEKNFATKIDSAEEVAVFVKLPRSFYISTPVGKYTPDWAIAFQEGAVRHIHFVAETKGSTSSMQLRKIEAAKLHCAREHFRAISSGSVCYDVVDSYEELLKKVMSQGNE